MVLPYYYITLKGNIKSMKAGSDKRKETSHLVLLSALTEGRDLEAEQALSAALIYLFSNQHLHHHLYHNHHHLHDRKYLAHALFRKLPSHGGSIYPKKICFANITFKFKDLRSPTGSNKFLKFYACLFIRSSPLLKASIEECHRSMITAKKTSPLRFTSKVLTVFNSFHIHFQVLDCAIVSPSLLHRVNSSQASLKSQICDQIQIQSIKFFLCTFSNGLKLNVRLAFINTLVAKENFTENLLSLKFKNF